MENKMETTIMGYIGYNIGDWANNIGIVEKKMETTLIRKQRSLVWCWNVLENHGKEMKNQRQPELL